MKKTLLIVCFALAATLSASASNVEKFMTKFETFVNQVTALDDSVLVGDKLATIEKQYDQFIKEYNETYNSQMTSEQITQFNRIRAKYQKKVLGSKAKRKGAAAKGFIEGLVKSQE